MGALIETPPSANRRFWLHRDQVLALILAPFVIGVLLIVVPVLLVVQGRPVLYVAERMKTPTMSFRLLKLRTMDGTGCGGVLGGHAVCRVTKLGRFLRACRIDELPQIWNVLLGDMRFIGPRPPLRRYVEAHPEIYEKVLSRPPGVTGLATVLFHQREAQLLKACRTSSATEHVYQLRCIPQKARLDRFYATKRNAGLDFLILYWTFSKLLSRSSPRRRSRLRPMRLNSRAWPA